MIQSMEEEYDPAERFKLIEESLCVASQSQHPETWPFLRAVKIPTPEPVSIWWWGGRDIALSNPVIRSWHYHENAEVFHGAEALEVVQREWSNWRSR